MRMVLALTIACLLAAPVVVADPVARAALTGDNGAPVHDNQNSKMAARENPSPDPAMVIGSFNDTLLAAMRQAKTLGYRGRYDMLAPAIDKTFDVPGMTLRAVGPAWTGLSDNQKSRLTAAFGRFITATFASRFDGYEGEIFEVQGTKALAGDMLVEDQLIKPDGERIRINYLTHQTGNGWATIDIYLDGTISEMAVRRSEFTAILKRSDADGLIAALESKTQQLAMN